MAGPGIPLECPHGKAAGMPHNDKHEHSRAYKLQMGMDRWLRATVRYTHPPKVRNWLQVAARSRGGGWRVLRSDKHVWRPHPTWTWVKGKGAHPSNLEVLTLSREVEGALGWTRGGGSEEA
eukprot:scaffold16814_cov126-Isochrysis_galbana.AAC.2